MAIFPNHYGMRALGSSPSAEMVRKSLNGGRPAIRRIALKRQPLDFNGLGLSADQRRALISKALNPRRAQVVDLASLRRSKQRERHALRNRAWLKALSALYRAQYHPMQWGGIFAPVHQKMATS